MLNIIVFLPLLLGNSVYFSGVDMIDGTPVFDIKPYIPHYDAPVMMRANQHVSLFDNGSHQILLDPLTTDREAPDGEETTVYDMPLSPLHSRVQYLILFSYYSFLLYKYVLFKQVRVPLWITEPLTQELTVEFSLRAREFLDALEINDIETTIVNILKEDPRSVYVRERYSNQFYTFQIGGYHVSCKFDDTKHIINVYRISHVDNLDNVDDQDGASCLSDI